MSKSTLRNPRIGIGQPEFADTSRWIEATVDSEFGPVTVVSTYVHTGRQTQIGKPRSTDS